VDKALQLALTCGRDGLSIALAWLSNSYSASRRCSRNSGASGSDGISREELGPAKRHRSANSLLFSC